MKVSELREYIEHLPGDMEVWRWEDSCCYGSAPIETEGIRISVGWVEEEYRDRAGRRRKRAVPNYGMVVLR